MRDAPALANPYEYREMLHTIIFKGEMTEEMKKRTQEQKVKDAKDAIGKAPPETAMAALEAQRERAVELARAAAEKRAELERPAD